MMYGIIHLARTPDGTIVGASRPIEGVNEDRFIEWAVGAIRSGYSVSPAPEVAVVVNISGGVCSSVLTRGAPEPYVILDADDPKEAGYDVVG